MNDPKFLDTAEGEIEMMFQNAKVSLTQLGFDLDKDRMANPDRVE